MEALQRAGAVVITQNINVEGKDANAQALDIIDALNRAKGMDRGCLLMPASFDSDTI